MCFKWQELNKSLGKELSISDIEHITKQLPNLSSVVIGGGEPFLRDDLPDICRLFEQNCDSRMISIPTNALMPKRIKRLVEEILDKTTTAKIVVGLSVDGIGENHDLIRGVKGNSEKLLKTYSLLTELDDPRFMMTANTAVSNLNVEEVPKIIEFVKNKMLLVWHHTFEVIRGSFDESKISPPSLEQYSGLIELEKNPILRYYHIKALQTLKQGKQVVKCKAGYFTPVIDAFGNVYACEGLPSIGNALNQEYESIWNNGLWKNQRDHIKSGYCSCTHICFMVPSIYLNKIELAKLLLYRWLSRCR